MGHRITGRRSSARRRSRSRPIPRCGADGARGARSRPGAEVRRGRRHSHRPRRPDQLRTRSDRSRDGPPAAATTDGRSTAPDCTHRRRGVARIQSPRAGDRHRRAAAESGAPAAAADGEPPDAVGKPHPAGPAGGERAGEGGGRRRAAAHAVGRAARPGRNAAVRRGELPDVGIDRRGDRGRPGGRDSVPGVLPAGLGRSLPAQAGEARRPDAVRKEGDAADPVGHRSADRAIPVRPNVHQHDRGDRIMAGVPAARTAGFVPSRLRGQSRRASVAWIIRQTRRG